MPITDGSDATPTLATWVVEADISNQFSGTLSKPRPSFIWFTGTLTSAAAATAVTLITDAKVGLGRKIVYVDAQFAVNGSTSWTTTAYVKVQDSAATEYSRVLVASLTDTAFGRIGQTPKTAQAAGAGFTGLTGLGTGKGLQIVADANGGAGSDLVVSGWALVVPV